MAPPNNDVVALLPRKTKGLLNRLSESSLPGIANNFEVLFTSYPRSLVSQTLVNEIENVLSSQVGLLEPFVMLYASLVYLVVHFVGIDLLAYLGLQFSRNFHDCYQQQRAHGTKDLSDERQTLIEKKLFNMIFFFSFLYTLQLVSVSLLHDLVFLFSESFNELDVELLVKLLRYTGSQMRQHDPATLKLIMNHIYSKTQSMETTPNYSRMKFMLELLDDLKANKKKLVKGDSEFVLLSKKNLVAIIRKRGLTPIEPLKLDLEAALGNESNAKWLVTGFARPKLEDELEKSASRTKPGAGPDGVAVKKKLKIDSTLDDMGKLADAQKMNTDIRRAIFTILMSAENYVDAHEKLLDLKLTKKQAREIAKIIVHCVGQEAAAYNPYYAFVAARFASSDKNYSLTFMYCFWDSLKELKNFTVEKRRNLALFFGQLLAKKVIKLSACKVIPFESVKVDKTLNLFVANMMSAALLQMPEPDLTMSITSLQSKSTLDAFQESFGFYLRVLLDDHKSLKLARDSEALLKSRILKALETLQSNSLAPSQSVNNDFDSDSGYRSFDDY